MGAEEGRPGPFGGFAAPGLPVNMFVGRVVELEDVRALLARERLITLTGAGGCGKTRLALEAIKDTTSFPDGAIVLDLAPITDERQVAPTLATLLGLNDGGVDTIGMIGRAVRDTRGLLVLDTCEHLVGACATLAEAILQTCPSMRVLATSREPLGVEGEVSYRVPSLAVPAQDAHDIETVDSVALFIDRARRVRANVRLTPQNAAAVAAICRRLDGVPLAIELAAARTRMMSIDQIVAGLDDRFRLLTGGSRTALPRQRTLQASVEWSYALLSEDERTIFRRLAVFPGSFALDAAEAVAGGDGLDPLSVLDGLSSLVDKSLVQATDEGRYRMLETIRHFAQGLLSDRPEEAQPARDRHLAYHLERSALARDGLHAETVFEWLKAVAADHDDCAAALTWAEQSGRHADAAVLAANIEPYWRLRGKAPEGRARLEGALARTLPDDVRARASTAAASLALHLWDLPAAAEFASGALPLALEIGDVESACQALSVLGWTASWAGRPDEAEDHHREAERLSSTHALAAAHATAVYGLGVTSMVRVDFAGAAGLLERAAHEARTCGAVGLLVNVLWNLLLVTWHLGDDERAAAAAAEGLAIADRLHDPDHRSVFTAWSAELLGQRGEHDAAARMLADARRIAGISVGPLPAVTVLAIGGLLAREAGDVASAVDALAQSGRVFAALGTADLPAAYALSYAAETASLQPDAQHTAGLVEEAIVLRDRSGTRLPPVSLAEAHLARQRGEHGAAEDCAHRALSEALETGLHPVALEALEVLGYLSVVRGDEVAGARLLGAASASRAARERQRPAGLEVLYRDALAAVAGLSAFADGKAMAFDDAAAYASRGRGERKRPAFGWDSLTPAETQVVALVAAGLSNAEICERLFMALGTVKTHLSHVYGKLGLSSRVQLAQEFSRRAG